MWNLTYLEWCSKQNNSKNIHFMNLYISLGEFEYLQASLPMTNIHSRRKRVVNALIKIKESGLLQVVTNLWLGTSFKQHINARRDNPSFLPAGIIQTKSVFFTLALGQIVAVVIGLAEIFLGRCRKETTAESNQYLRGCPNCGHQYDAKQWKILKTKMFNKR